MIKPVRLIFILFAIPAIFWSVAPTAANAQSRNEITFARLQLAALQRKSITRNREYCGYFGYNRENQLVSGPIKRGGQSGCRPIWPQNTVRLVASFHTHGAFDARIASELPSLEDVAADVADGNFGFVATPGGRMWLIDPRDSSVRLICDVGCLPQDRNFVRGLTGNIQNRYNWAQLERFYANH